MAETCLWVVTRRNIFGISLKKLIDLEVHWPGHPVRPMNPSFKYHLQLPEMFMRPFSFDGKVFLAGGLAQNPNPCEHPIPSSKFYRLLFEDDDDAGNNSNKLLKISEDDPMPWKYAMSLSELKRPMSFSELEGLNLEDDDNNSNKLLKISEADSSIIPPPPTLYVSDSFVTDIGGNVYLLVHNDIMTPREQGLWVLSDDKKEWKPLPEPPPLYEHKFADYCGCFVLQDKLFMPVDDQQKVFMYAFDTRSSEWTKVEDKVIDSFALWRSDDVCLPSTTVSSLPDVCNCSVALTFSVDKVPGDFQVRVKIDAMLVNKQDHSVVRYQSLDDCSDAILLPSFSYDDLCVKFIDLGEGVVCALVLGDVPFSTHLLESEPVLCIVVFALSLLAQEIDIEAPEKRQRFLSVDHVYVSQAFTMEDYEPAEMQGAFIFPPAGDAGIRHLFQRRTPRSDSGSASLSYLNLASNTPGDRSVVAAQRRASIEINRLFLSTKSNSSTRRVEEFK